MPEQTGGIHAALVAAQAEFTVIERGETGQAGDRRYKYASLSDVLKAVLPALQKNDILALQRTIIDGDGMVMETTLHHAPSGTEITSLTPLPLPTNWQQWGSALTYARRYSIQALLGIAPEDDEDGASAQGVPRRAAPAERASPAERDIAKAQQEGLAALKAIRENPVDQQAWVAEHFPKLAQKGGADYTLEDWGDITTLAREQAGQDGLGWGPDHAAGDAEADATAAANAEAV